MQDLFAAKDVKVNTPTMLKGKSQLEENEVMRRQTDCFQKNTCRESDWFGKDIYKILKKELPAHRLYLASRIVNVCFKLTLFRRSIVSSFA